MRAKRYKSTVEIYQIAILVRYFEYDFVQISSDYRKVNEMLRLNVQSISRGGLDDRLIYGVGGLVVYIPVRCYIGRNENRVDFEWSYARIRRVFLAGFQRAFFESKYSTN